MNQIENPFVFMKIFPNCRRRSAEVGEVLSGPPSPAGFWRREFGPPPDNEKGLRFPPLNLFTALLSKGGKNYLRTSSKSRAMWRNIVIRTNPFPLGAMFFRLQDRRVIHKGSFWSREPHMAPFFLHGKSPSFLFPLCRPIRPERRHAIMPIDACAIGSVIQPGWIKLRRLSYFLLGEIQYRFPFLIL